MKEQDPKTQRRKWGTARRGINLKKLIVEYFQSIFIAADHTGSMDFLDNSGSRVINTMNENVCTDSMREEIFIVLQHM